VMRAGGDGPNGARLRGLIVVLWRAGLRVSEALALGESDVDCSRGESLSAGERAESGARSAWTPRAGSN
jgi:site-specific recombinase XerD